MNRKFITLAVVWLLGAAATLSAQVTIGSGEKPETFSVLELVSSSTKGLRLPQLTTAQRDAMEATAEFQTAKTGAAMGLTIFNTDTHCVETWNGTKWIDECEACRYCPCLESVVTGQPQVQSVPMGYTTATGTVSAVYNTGLAHPTTYQWYSTTDQAQNTGGTAIAGATGTAYTLTAAQTSAPGTYYFYCVASNTCRTESLPSDVYTVEVTTPNPQVISTTDGSICYPGGAAILSATASQRAAIRWWSSQRSGTLLHTGDTYTTPDISANKSYWAEAYYTYAGADYVSTPRIEVKATVINAKPVVTNTSVQVCPGETAVLKATSTDADCVIDWYDAATGGSPVASNTGEFTTPALNSGSSIYYAVTRNTVIGCISERVRATASVASAPTISWSSAGQGIPNLYNDVASNGSRWRQVVSAAASSGATINWYDSNGNYVRSGPDLWHTTVDYNDPAGTCRVATYTAEAVDGCGRKSARLSITFEGSSTDVSPGLQFESMRVSSTGDVTYQVSYDSNVPAGGSLAFGMKQIFTQNGTIKNSSAGYGRYSYRATGSNDHSSIQALPASTPGNVWESECTFASSCGGEYLRMVIRSENGNATCKVYSMSGTLRNTITVPWGTDISREKLLP